jgi:hypothetical protein
METAQHNNTGGNPVLNQSRSDFNNKVSAYSMLGKTKKVIWYARRRYRTI